MDRKADIDFVSNATVTDSAPVRRIARRPDDMNFEINQSLGAFPGYSCLKAMEMAFFSTEPYWGKIGMRHVQLCPQNQGILNEKNMNKIQSMSLSSRMRLHGNIQIDEKLSHAGASLANSPSRVDYFKKLAQLNHHINGSRYTIQAGDREDCKLADLPGVMDRLTDIFSCEIGVKGMYPVAYKKYLIDTWDEYAWLLNSGMKYALDMAHINIIAIKEQNKNIDLLKDLLSSENCIEIHVSSNNGRKNYHGIMESKPWWYNTLNDQFKGYDPFNIKLPVIFSEGIQV